MQAIQKTLMTWTNNGVPYEIITALVSARKFNTTISETDLGYGNGGKLRELKINYYPPVCEDTGTCSDNICSTGVVQQLKQDYFNISECTASAVYQLNKNDIRYVDGNWVFADHVKAQIMAALPTVRRKWALALTAKLVANVGVVAGTGNQYQLLPWVDNSTGGINPHGIFDIQRVYRDGALNEPYIVGGGSDIWNWKKTIPMGGVNAAGLDVSKMGMNNVYYDSLVDAAFADTSNQHMIAFDPQMLKLVTFNDNAGIFSTDLDNIEAIDAIYQRGGTDYINGTILDPVTGVLWDLNVKYNDCEGYWTYQWKLKWDIFFMPPMTCQYDLSGDPLQGVNGVMHFKTCPVNVVECPDGSALSPATSRVFNYSTSGLTFPLYVAKLELGTQTTYPNESVANASALKDLFNANYNGITFDVSGSNINYTGIEAIAGQINDTANISFS